MPHTGSNSVFFAFETSLRFYYQYEMFRVDVLIPVFCAQDRGHGKLQMLPRPAL